MRVRIRSVSGKLASSGTKAGSPCTSTTSKDSSTRFAAARALARLDGGWSTSRMELTRRHPVARARSTSGSSSKRSSRRPNGQVSVTSTCGACSSNAASSRSRRGGPPDVVDLAPARVHQGAVAGIRDPGGGKRDDAHPAGPAGREIRDLHPAGHVHDVRPSSGQGQRDGDGPALMADPHQVLDPEHHPGRGGRGGGGHGRAATWRSPPLSIALEPDVRLVEGERAGGRVEPETVRAGPVEAHRGLAGEVPSAGEPQQRLDDPLVGDRDHVR